MCKFQKDLYMYVYQYQYISIPQLQSLRHHQDCSAKLFDVLCLKQHPDAGRSWMLGHNLFHVFFVLVFRIIKLQRELVSMKQT